MGGLDWPKDQDWDQDFFKKVCGGQTFKETILNSLKKVIGLIIG